MSFYIPLLSTLHVTVKGKHTDTHTHTYTHTHAIYQLTSGKKLIYLLWRHV